MATVMATRWFDSLTEQDQELYTAIEEQCSEFEKLDGELCREFMDELSELGITTGEQFENAFIYQSDAYEPCADFVEHIVTEMDCQELPPYLVIDWQASWDRNYRHDFSSIEFDGETYFFLNHF